MFGEMQPAETVLLAGIVQVNWGKDVHIMYYGVFSISLMTTSWDFLLVAAFMKSRSSARGRTAIKVHNLRQKNARSLGEEGTCNTRFRLLENECGMQARVS